MDRRRQPLRNSKTKAQSANEIGEIIGESWESEEMEEFHPRSFLKTEPIEPPPIKTEPGVSGCCNHCGNRSPRLVEVAIQTERINLQESGTQTVKQFMVNQEGAQTVNVEQFLVKQEGAQHDVRCPTSSAIATTESSAGTLHMNIVKDEACGSESEDMAELVTVKVEPGSSQDSHEGTPLSLSTSSRIG